MRPLLGASAFPALALNEQEIAALEKAAAERLLADPPGAPEVNTPPQWLESGTPAVGTRRSSLIIEPRNGRLPAVTPAGQRQAADLVTERTVLSGPASFTPWERCITRGFSAVMLPSSYNNNLQIVQTPGYVTIVTEMIHEARIVPLDGRAAPPRGVRALMGVSRGRWDGDTLVVQKTNFLKQVDFRVCATGSSGTAPTSGSSSASRARTTARSLSPDRR